MRREEAEWKHFWKSLGEAEFPAITFITGTGIRLSLPGFETSLTVPYSEIPRFPKTHLKGHEKRLYVLTDGTNRVAVMSGRYHLYEVGDPYLASITSHFACALGTKAVLQISAVGGISSNIHPSDLVLFTDYINFTGENPLSPPHSPFQEPMFVPMHPSFSPKLNELLRKLSVESGIFLKSGVYAFVRGPMFETESEIQFFKRVGADVVGMSTVPETIIARAYGVECAGLGIVTNRAPALYGEETHEGIISAAERGAEKLRVLLKKGIGRLMQSAAGN